MISWQVHFSEIGKAEGKVVYKSVVAQAVTVAKEEASKFCHEEGFKAGAGTLEASQLCTNFLSPLFPNYVISLE